MPAGERFSVSKLPALLKNPALIALYVVTVCMATGYYTGYSYIEPFMQQVGGVESSVVTLSLAVFGVMGLMGSWLFGRPFDGHRLSFLTVTLAGVAVALLPMQASAATIATVFAMCALWGCCGTAFNVAFQAELIKYTSEYESTVAMSIFSGLFNLGIGSAVGGVVVSSIGIACVGYVGGAIAAVGAAVAVTLLFGAIRRTVARAE